MQKIVFSAYLFLSGCGSVWVIVPYETNWGKVKINGETPKEVCTQAGYSFFGMSGSAKIAVKVNGQTTLKNVSEGDFTVLDNPPDANPAGQVLTPNQKRKKETNNQNAGTAGNAGGEPFKEAESWQVELCNEGGNYHNSKEAKAAAEEAVQAAENLVEKTEAYKKTPSDLALVALYEAVLKAPTAKSKAEEAAKAKGVSAAAKAEAEAAVNKVKAAKAEAEAAVNKVKAAESGISPADSKEGEDEKSL